MKKEQFNQYMRDRYAARPDVREYQIGRMLAHYHAGHWAEVQAQNQELKREVLTHYGKGGKLQCCWADCTVDDLDVLSLDHIEDDGAEHRKHIGTRIYRWAKRHGFPPTLQTLCMNHQWKKELTRRRRVC
jgi:hypothetical protein